MTQDGKAKILFVEICFLIWVQTSKSEPPCLLVSYLYHVYIGQYLRAFRGHCFFFKHALTMSYSKRRSGWFMTWQTIVASRCFFLFRGSLSFKHLLYIVFNQCCVELMVAGLELYTREHQAFVTENHFFKDHTCWTLARHLWMLTAKKDIAMLVAEHVVEFTSPKLTLKWYLKGGNLLQTLAAAMLDRLLQNQVPQFRLT